MRSSKSFIFSTETAKGGFQLVASVHGIRRMYWPGQAKGGENRHNRPAWVARLLKTTAKQLEDYFAGKQVRFTVKLDLSGLSPFAQKVLRELTKVPYGETVTYGGLAKRAGSPKAARAVGNILAKNPLPIIVPCHRVIASDGKLGGFSAPKGVAIKRQLLSMENKATACGL